MTKPFEFFNGVEAEKAEAKRRFNNRRISRRNIFRATVVASVCYLWFPTVTISLQSAGDWLSYRTGPVMITDRSVVFFVSVILVALIFLLSIDRHEEDDERRRSSVSYEPDLYNQYASSYSAAVTVSVSGEKVEGDDESGKQIVSIDRDERERRRCSVSEKPDLYTSSSSAVTVSDEKVGCDDDDSSKQIVAAAIIAEADRETVTMDLKISHRRTKSEMKKVITRSATEIICSATEYRRSESAKEIQSLSDEEFNLEIERRIRRAKTSKHTII
ncbi:unnamed protein product [Cochlearia groenlandica]